MGRAILALSGSAVSLLPRPFATFRNIFGGFWHELTRDAIRPYRPELHYMRGPGPAWRAKHGVRRLKPPFPFTAPCLRWRGPDHSGLQ